MKDRTLVFYKKGEGTFSTFKVLEPVVQRPSSERRSRFFRRSADIELFREFDEFHIPTECHAINIFHTYIAVATQKGFELFTLEKKVPIIIPDAKDPGVASILSRLFGQRSLGMFRLSDSEFFLCYEECGVYINKHGDISRSVIVEFLGKVESVAFYCGYLVLFNPEFVEIRDPDNGRLRQIIAGKDIRCLDYGLNPLRLREAAASNSKEETVTLKFAMAHPERPGFQLVLELVLNIKIEIPREGNFSF